jgi:hypothetical protein
MITTLAEDADTRSQTKVADMVVTDDGLGTNGLSLTGSDAALFEIEGTVLYLKAGSTLDYETNPALDVSVAVDDATAGSTPDDTADLSIAVTNVNEPPSVSLGNTTESLAENADTGSRHKVADIVVTDDALGTHGLSLTGSDAALFEIEGTALYLKAGSTLDYETNPSLDVTVTVDDVMVGGTPDDTVALSVAVTDVNEPPTQPTCVSPADEVTGISLTPTLASSAFSDPDAGAMHTTTQWQVDDNGDFSSPAWEAEDTDSDKTSEAVPAGVLAYDTTYYWRVCYEDSQGAWSEWSDPSSFTTGALPQAATTRCLPSSYTGAPNVITVTINLTVDQSNSPNGVIVTEYFPAGWTLVPGSDTPALAATVNDANGVGVKWLLQGAGGQPLADTTIQYQLSYPATESGTKTFTGDVKYNDAQGNPVQTATGGDTTIVRQTCHPADVNHDQVVGDFELLDYIDRWVGGQVGDFELLDTIDLWIAGHYYWDEGEGKFQPGQPPVGLSLTRSTPLPGATVTAAPAQIEGQFSEPLEASSSDGYTFWLRASGGDGSFDDGYGMAGSVSSHYWESDVHAGADTRPYLSFSGGYGRNRRGRPVISSRSFSALSAWN